MNEDQNYRLNYRLHLKYQRNEKFTEDERTFFFECLDDEDIETIKFCKDELYMRLFNKYHHTFSSEHPKHKKFIISFKELLRFQSFVNDWKQVVKKTNHSQHLLQYVCKETREEIKKLKKSFSFLRIDYRTYGHIKREFFVPLFFKRSPIAFDKFGLNGRFFPLRKGFTFCFSNLKKGLLKNIFFLVAINIYLILF